MGLGFTLEELARSFATTMNACIDAVKAGRARETAVSLGEFPTEQLFRQQVADKMADLSPNELSTVLFITFLTVIDANNKRVTQQFEMLLKDTPVDRPGTQTQP